VFSVQSATSNLDLCGERLTKELGKLVNSGLRLRFWKSKKKAIARILLEIRAINKKKRSFESGFLSQEGIKDREWYRHKGTAPGKVSVDVSSEMWHHYHRLIDFSLTCYVCMQWLG